MSDGQKNVRLIIKQMAIAPKNIAGSWQYAQQHKILIQFALVKLHKKLRSHSEMCVDGTE